MADPSPCTATGYAAAHLPPGAEADQVMRLIRLGSAFKTQHGGKRPEFLHRYVASLAERIAPPLTFKRLLDELEIEAARRNLKVDGKALAPVESVNRVWQLVTYHHPQRGALQVTFGTLRNHLTVLKKD